jgi:hypothetical protein
MMLLPQGLPTLPVYSIPEPEEVVRWPKPEVEYTPFEGAEVQLALLPELLIAADAVALLVLVLVLVLVLNVVAVLVVAGRTSRRFTETPRLTPARGWPPAVEAFAPATVVVCAGAGWCRVIVVYMVTTSRLTIVLVLIARLAWAPTCLAFNSAL